MEVISPDIVLSDFFLPMILGFISSVVLFCVAWFGDRSSLKSSIAGGLVFFVIVGGFSSVLFTGTARQDRIEQAEDRFQEGYSLSIVDRHPDIADIPFRTSDGKMAIVVYLNEQTGPQVVIVEVVDKHYVVTQDSVLREPVDNGS